MEYKDIVLIVLVVGMLFMATKVYKNNNIENFAPDQVELIKEEINRQYNMDIEAIRNLGAISKSLLTGTNYHSTEPANPGTLTIPADTIIEGDLVVNPLKEISFLPQGCIIMWSYNTIPKSWAPCDGQSYILNGDGTTTVTSGNGVQTPDLRGRFVLGMGQGNDLTNRKLNDIDGEEQHTLTIDEMPSHSHVFKERGPNPSGKGDQACHHSCAEFPAAPDKWRVPKDSELSGKGAAHNNMPPYYVLIYIMKL